MTDEQLDDDLEVIRNTPITAHIYHIVGIKVGCTTDIKRRIKDNLKANNLPDDHEVVILAELYATPKMLADLEEEYSVLLGYGTIPAIERYDNKGTLLRLSGTGACEYAQKAIESGSHTTANIQPWYNPSTIDNQIQLRMWRQLPELYQLWLDEDQPKYKTFANIINTKFGYKPNTMSLIKIFNDPDKLKWILDEYETWQQDNFRVVEYAKQQESVDTTASALF